MIRLHHAKNARSVRVRFLLEELGVPYELVTHAFKPEILRSPEYLAVHPMGLIPVIEDGPVKMFESGAIVEYLLEQYGGGRLAPAPGSAERAEYLQWFHFGEATLARHVSEIVRHRYGLPEAERNPSVVEDQRKRVHEALEVVERAMGDREYMLASGFSAADIMLSYGVSMAKLTGELPKDLPTISAYLGRLRQRPAYVTAWS